MARWGRRTWQLRLVGASCAALAGGCSDGVELRVEVLTGLETDAFSQDPPVASVTVRATGVHEDGDIELVAETEPGGAFSLGEAPADALLTFSVEGRTQDGDLVVSGRTIGLVLGEIATGSVPVFASRVETWARPPGELARTHVDAPASPLAERFLLLSGGAEAIDGAGDTADRTLGDYYDLLSLGPAESPSFSLAAQSLWTQGGVGLLFDAAEAISVDFASGAMQSVDAPAGLGGYQTVAGAHAIELPDGGAAFVGATRADGPSDRALRWTSDGELSAASLSVERQGAAATWAPDLGIIVLAGSDEEPGGERIADDATASAPLALPADPTEGAALAVGGTTLVLMGGALRDEDGIALPAPTRTLSLPCDPCELTELPDATPDATLVRSRAFSLGEGRFLLVGERIGEDGERGLMTSYLITTTPPAAEELPLRVPRMGGTVTPTPNGSLALLGGLDESGAPARVIELFQLRP